MLVKDIIDEDFINYKKPSMFISTYICSFKCNKECGQAVCQNLPLASQPIIEVDNDDLTMRYLHNDLTSAVVIGGLEPFDDFTDLMHFILCFRSYCNDDIVIYTGYNADEITEQIEALKWTHNIYVKFGRYIPNQQPHFDEVLGVKLASDNQKGVKIC